VLAAAAAAARAMGEAALQINANAANAENDTQHEASTVSGIKIT
jgi:hypothetical protein